MGGNLAASVSLATREEDGPCFQLLIYPSADPAGRTPSRDAFARGFLLEDDTIEWFHRTYLRDIDAADPRFSVLRAPTHAGVAPAYIATAGFDPLRDEGHAYADALEAAGVEVTRRCFDAHVHGFIHMTGAVPSADEAMREVGAALREGFERA